jgi:CHAT domain-containing protein/Tfp pilus assembly protein PilF
VPRDRAHAEAVRLRTEAEQFRSLAEHEAYRRALEKYEASVPIWHSLGEKAEEAQALHWIAVLHLYRMEREEALPYYRRALVLWNDLGNRLKRAQVLTSMGLVYYRAGDTRSALDYLDQALGHILATGDSQRTAFVLNALGHTHDSLGNYADALECYNRAITVSQATKELAAEYEGVLLNNIGHAHFGLGRTQDALDAFNKSVIASRAINDLAFEAQALSNIGVVHAATGKPQVALDYHDRALAAARAAKNPNVESTALYRAAKVERDLGNLGAALSRIEAAITVIESERSQMTDFELRAYFFAGRQDYYALNIDILVRLHERDPKAGFDVKAFEASERGRARTLIETLAEADIDVRDRVDPALLEHEREVRRKRDAAVEAQFRLQNGTPTKEQAEEAARSVNSLADEHREVEAQIRKASLRHAAIARPQTSTLAEVRTLLDRDTVLLEYSLGEARSYLWVVTPDSFAGYALPPRREIETAASAFLTLLTGSSTPAKVDARAAALGRMLLAPAAKHIKGKRLAVVADGALEYLPFAALANPAISRRVIPLVVDHEVVRLPSASTLAALRAETATRAPAPKHLALLADPVFSLDDERLASVKKPDQPAEIADVAHTVADAIRHVDLPKRGGGLARLLASRREADKIAALLPEGQARVALGFEADLEAATSPDLRQYRVLHFATHGVVNTTRPEMSGLVLSLVDEKGQPKDGFLSLARVYALKLSADLVVLSACQTGLGTEIRGEGLVGLTRGFMYAGSPRVVATLWEVQDDSTAELMERFYRAMLTEKLPAAAALRRAQVSMWNEERWRSPRQWAGFVFQGEWR